MKFLQEFIHNAVWRDRFKQLISEGRTLNLFYLLRRMGLERAQAPMHGDHIQQTHAAIGAWINGYREAIDDMELFFERYEKLEAKQESTEMVILKQMVATGEITQEEYNSLINSDNK